MDIYEFWAPEFLLRSLTKGEHLDGNLGIPKHSVFKVVDAGDGMVALHQRVDKKKIPSARAGGQSRNSFRAPPPHSYPAESWDAFFVKIIKW